MRARPIDPNASPEEAARILAERERNRKAQAKWRAEHREQHRENCKRWAERYPERHDAKRQRYLARQKAAPGRCTPSQMQARAEVFDHRCYLCDEPGVTGSDHVKPLDRGGSNWPANMRPICKRCNSVKGSRWITDLPPGVRRLDALIGLLRHAVRFTEHQPGIVKVSAFRGYYWLGLEGVTPIRPALYRIRTDDLRLCVAYIRDRIGADTDLLFMPAPSGLAWLKTVGSITFHGRATERLAR
jgi:5-methylcytosine-specific restriction endonuclease McrA